jgi:hypothetical protein
MWCGKAESHRSTLCTDAIMLEQILVSLIASAIAAVAAWLVKGRFGRRRAPQPPTTAPQLPDAAQPVTSAYDLLNEILDEARVTYPHIWLVEAKPFDSSDRSLLYRDLYESLRSRSPASYVMDLIVPSEFEAQPELATNLLIAVRRVAQRRRVLRIDAQVDTAHRLSATPPRSRVTLHLTCSQPPSQSSDAGLVGDDGSALEPRRRAA